MLHARGGSLWPMGLALVLGGLGFLGAFGGATKHVRALGALRAAPRATLDQPRQGPAVYAGWVDGPPGRADWQGNLSAAHWWWVIERVSKNNYKTACFEHAIDGLVLRDGAASARLAMFEGEPSLSLLGAGRDSDWSDPLLIDLAKQPVFKSTRVPEFVKRCDASNRSFVSRFIPAGAKAEVFGCYEGGALVACPGFPTGVLSLEGLGVHRSRRAFDAASPFLFVSAFFGALLIALTVRALRFRTRTFAALVPGGPD